MRGVLQFRKVGQSGAKVARNPVPAQFRQLDQARARLNKVLKMTEALQAKNVQKAQELGLAKRRPQSARPRPQSAGPARKAVAMSASLAQLPAV